jgi:hypothetical protein
MWLEKEGMIHLTEVTILYGTRTEKYLKEGDEEEGYCMYTFEVSRREEMKKSRSLLEITRRSIILTVGSRLLLFHFWERPPKRQEVPYPNY